MKNTINKDQVRVSIIAKTIYGGIFDANKFINFMKDFNKIN